MRKNKGERKHHRHRLKKNDFFRKICALTMCIVLAMGMTTFAYAGDEDALGEASGAAVADTQPTTTQSDVEPADGETANQGESSSDAVSESAEHDTVTKDSSVDEDSTSEEVPEGSNPDTFDPNDTNGANNSESNVAEPGETQNEDGTRTVTVVEEDGTVVETVYDQDGNLVSESRRKESSSSSETTKTETETTGPTTTQMPAVGGSVSVTVTPGNTASTTTDITDLLDNLKPDTNGEEWVDLGNGVLQKTENIENGSITTQVTEKRDETGRLVEYTSHVELKRTETSIVPFDPADVPEKGTFDMEDGTTKQVSVTEMVDQNDNLIGYEVVEEVYNDKGDLIKKITRSVTNAGTVTTTITETRTTTTKVDGDGTTVDVTMGEVVAGDKHGNLNTSGLDVDMDQFASTEGIDFDALGEDDLVFVAGVGVKSKHELAILWGTNTDSMPNKNSLYATQYIVVDKAGNKHVVYCADMSVPADTEIEYYLTNVEDADYYTNSANHGAGKNNLKDPEGGAHLREIATNGYWGTAEGTGSLDKVIQDMLNAKANGDPTLADVSEDEIRALTSDLALSATQAAIWRHCSRWWPGYSIMGMTK